MKRILTILAALLVWAVSSAREDNLDLGLETRVSFTTSDSFAFDYCALYAKGSVGEKFSYYMYGYPNKITRDQSYFDAMSWAMLAWKPSEHFKIELGKQMIEYAGTEYDYKPLDVFAPAEYWNNYAAFQLGVTGQYLTASGDIFSVQVSQSPFDKYSPSSSLYAYSASARGSHDVFGYSASFNMFEYSADKFAAHQVLSGWTRLGPVKLELDLINRTAASDFKLLKDFSLVSQAIVTVGGGVQLFVKYTHDNNNDSNDFDYMVKQLSDISVITGGVFWRPEYAGGRVRFHAYYSSVSGHSSPAGSVLQPGTSHFCIGTTWDIKLVER